MSSIKVVWLYQLLTWLLNVFLVTLNLKILASDDLWTKVLFYRPDGEGTGESESAQQDGEKEAESRKGKPKDVLAWYRYIMLVNVHVCRNLSSDCKYTFTMCVKTNCIFHIKVNTVVM